MSDVLVYDRPGAGHERRAVEVISRVLDAQSLIEPLDTALPKLKAWPGPVFLCTANGYVDQFSSLCFARLRTGRRTIGQFLLDPSRSYRRWTCQWLRTEIALRLPTVGVISGMPPAPGRPQRFRQWLYDTEWWDLAIAPLANVDAPLPKSLCSQTIVYMGKALQRKGIAFFLQAAQESARRNMNLQFVIIGDTSTLSEEHRRSFEAASGTILPRTEDSARFVSFIRQADWVWCCYDPTWEASSGIFGRTLQLGTKSIVRKDSYLAHFQSRYASGIQVDFGDIDGLLERLAGPYHMRGNSVDISELASFSIKRMRAGCGLSL